MKIVLASYFAEETHGPGRKIGITHDKPPALDDLDYDCEFRYEALAPDRGDMIGYYVDRNKLKKEAGGWNFDEDQKERFKKIGKKFSDAYEEKLKKFVDHVIAESEETGRTPQDIVGLEEGDTLLSLEKGGNTSYRSLTAEYLRKLGYDVNER